MDFLAWLWQHPLAGSVSAGLLVALAAAAVGVATVTAQAATQLTNLDTGKKNAGASYGNALRQFQIDFVQSGAGATGSTVELFRVPPGRWWLYLFLSELEWTALGSGETMDVGYAAYTGVDGTAVVADTDAFDNDVAVATAGHAALGSDLAAKSGGKILLESRNGVSLVATFTSIPTAAELHGYVVLSN